MRVNEVSNVGFTGKINFDKKMSKPLQEYVNKVFDYKINGKTARELIAQKSYDVGVYNLSSKKAIHPKIAFITSFKVDNEEMYYNHKIRTNYPVVTGAKELMRYLDWVDKTKEDRGGYNNFWEKLVVLSKKILK